MIKKYFCLTFGLSVLLSAVLCILAKLVFEWKYDSTLILLSPVIIYAFFYFIAYLINIKRINDLYNKGEYDKGMALVKKLSKWYSGGANDSMFHLFYAIAYFMKGDDEKFQEECEMILDHRLLFYKYYWLAIYFAIRRNEERAKEQYSMLSNINYSQKLKKKAQDVEILIKIISENCSNKDELIEAALKEFKSERIRNFLLEKRIQKSM